MQSKRAPTNRDTDSRGRGLRVPRARLKRVLESGEVRVDASSDCARRDGGESGCDTAQLDAGVEVDDCVDAVRGESVVVEKRRRPRCGADAEVSGMLPAEDLKLILGRTTR